MLNGTRRNGSVNGAAKNGTNGVHKDTVHSGRQPRPGVGRPAPGGHRRSLSRPLDPALVSHRRGRGGKTFSYIEGHVAIARGKQRSSALAGGDMSLPAMSPSARSRPLTAAPAR